MTIRTLLVDDNPDFLAAVRLFLDTMPAVQVIGEARNGQDALFKTALLQPDLVLLDISMPDMSGLEVARRIKSWAEPPAIAFLSMNISEEYQTATCDLGALGFLEKSKLSIELPLLIERLVRIAAGTGAAC